MKRVVINKKKYYGKNSHRANIGRACCYDSAISFKIFPDVESRWVQRSRQEDIKVRRRVKKRERERRGDELAWHENWIYTATFPAFLLIGAHASFKGVNATLSDAKHHLARVNLILSVAEKKKKWTT